MRNPRSDGLTTKDQIEVVVDRFEKEVITPIISEIDRVFAAQFLFHIFLISIGIYINLDPSPASIIGSLVGGFIVMAINGRTAYRIYKIFIKDRKTLMMSMADLKLSFATSSEDDEASLKESITIIEAFIEAYLEPELAEPLTEVGKNR